MNQAEVIAKLQTIFDTVFLEPVVLTPAISARDVPEWDSLTLGGKGLRRPLPRRRSRERQKHRRVRGPDPQAEIGTVNQIPPEFEPPRHQDTKLDENSFRPDGTLPPESAA